jgi:hypothetical protein
MMRKMFARLGAMASLGVLALVPSSIAQTPTCSGEAFNTTFGQMCLVRNDLPSITEEDYGAIRLRFRPPADLNQVIPQNAMRGSWLDRGHFFFKRAFCSLDSVCHRASGTR